MVEEGKGVALAILGIVAVIAVVGLVLLFTGATGKVAGTMNNKVYGGGEIRRGLDQYQDPDRFVRYADSRVYSGALYGYQYGDDFRDRNQDSGDGVPYATYDADYKRTGPVRENQCPWSPYNDRSSSLYANGRECVPVGVNPNSGEQEFMPERASDMCCI